MEFLFNLFRKMHHSAARRIQTPWTGTFARFAIVFRVEIFQNFRIEILWEALWQLQKWQ